MKCWGSLADFCNRQTKATAWATRGRARLSQKSYREAADDCQRALQLDAWAPRTLRFQVRSCRLTLSRYVAVVFGLKNRAPWEWPFATWPALLATPRTRVVWPWPLWAQLCWNWVGEPQPARVPPEFSTMPHGRPDSLWLFVRCRCKLVSTYRVQWDSNGHHRIKRCVSIAMLVSILASKEDKCM